MIILALWSFPYSSICIDGNKVQISKLNDYNGEYDQGIADFTENEDIIGLFVDRDIPYLLINNIIVNLTDKKIQCDYIRNCDIRNFILKIDGQEIENITYKSKCTALDILTGDNEEDFDFLIHLNNILSDDNKLKKFCIRFCTGYKRKLLRAIDSTSICPVRDITVIDTYIK